MLNPEKISQEHLTDLSISPVRCSQFMLGNPKKSLFNIIVHTPHLVLFSFSVSWLCRHFSCSVQTCFFVCCFTFANDMSSVSVQSVQLAAAHQIDFRFGESLMTAVHSVDHCKVCSWQRSLEFLLRSPGISR